MYSNSKLNTVTFEGNTSTDMGDRVREVDHNVRVLTFVNVEIYKGRVIITDGTVFMRFWCGQRYPSLTSIREAIDNE